MASFNTLLDEALDEWYTVRKGFIAEVKNIPAARISFRPTLESRSALELVQHVLENAIVTTEELTREDANLQRAPYEQLMNIYAPNIAHADTKEKAIDLLVEQFRDAEHRFHECGEVYMMQRVTLFNGKQKTRLSVLWQGIAHEMYHRGQIALAARLLGLEPALTRELRMGGISSGPLSSSET